MQKRMRSAKDIFARMKKEGCRQITFHYNPQTNLKLIWVLDSLSEKRDISGKLKEVSTSGGTRFAHNDADRALEDALQLARAMTRKAKVIGIREGGSKAVVVADRTKNQKFLHSIGDFIQMHNGLFKTAIDLGFAMKEGKQIAARTEYVDSLSHLEKGLGSTGENTAEGLLCAYEIISKEFLKKPLEKCSIAVQGLGAVGLPLAKRLLAKGCRVLGSDVLKSNCRAAKNCGVKIVSSHSILFQDVDILAPC